MPTVEILPLRELLRALVDRGIERLRVCDRLVQLQRQQRELLLADGDVGLDRFGLGLRVLLLRRERRDPRIRRGDGPLILRLSLLVARGVLPRDLDRSLEIADLLQYGIDV